MLLALSQMRIHSHPRPHSQYVWTAKVLVRLRGCVGSPALALSIYPKSALSNRPAQIISLSTLYQVVTKLGFPIINLHETLTIGPALNPVYWPHESRKLPQTSSNKLFGSKKSDIVLLFNKRSS